MNSYMAMAVVRIVKWMVVAKGGMSFLEDNGVPEILKRLTADVKVEGLSGIRGVSAVENFQLFKTLEEVGCIDRSKIIKEFTERNEEGLDIWANRNIYSVKQGGLVATKSLLLKQVSEALHWRMHVNSVQLLDAKAVLDHNPRSSARSDSQNAAGDISRYGR